MAEGDGNVSRQKEKVKGEFCFELQQQMALERSPADARLIFAFLLFPFALTDDLPEFLQTPNSRRARLRHSRQN
jgi:hypothetical protein